MKRDTAIVLTLLAVAPCLCFWEVFQGQLLLPTDWVYRDLEPWKRTTEVTDIANSRIKDAVLDGYALDLVSARGAREGRVALWNRYAGGGVPHLAGGFSRMLYPPFWLYAVCEPETARNVEILLHLFLAEVFAFLFLRRIGAGLGGALVGSIAFGFTPSLVHRAEIPFIFPSLVWFPLLLYFVEGVVSTGKRRWVLGLSLAVGLQLLAGHFPDIFLHFIGAGLYALTLTRVAILVLLPFEHFSGGQPYQTVPAGPRAPEVYRWLETTLETDSVVELPLYPRSQLRRHSLYMLFSTLHWRPIVFGRTSFYPPVTAYLRWQVRDFPDNDSIGLLEGLGVKRVVVHPNVWPPQVRRERLAELQAFSGRLVQEGRFDPLSGRMYEEYGLGDERVYELSQAGTVPSTASLCSPGGEIDPNGWRLTGDAATPYEWAIDRDRDTKWRTDGQLPGMKLEVDLGREETIAAVRLTLGYPHDNFPRDLTLKARREGPGASASSASTTRTTS